MKGTLASMRGIDSLSLSASLANSSIPVICRKWCKENQSHPLDKFVIVLLAQLSFCAAAGSQRQS
jgi:hypothetical protein